jgi:hypothetical protein
MLSGAAAPGGKAGMNSGAGGIGGASGNTAGANGASVSNPGKLGGGGGGGVGRIAIKTLSGSDMDLGATLSPDLTDQNSVAKRPTVITTAVFQ